MAPHHVQQLQCSYEAEEDPTSQSLHNTKPQRLKQAMKHKMDIQFMLILHQWLQPLYIRAVSV